MNKIIMLDFDGVVLDQSYRLTKDIRPAIRRLQSSGAIIVPNSDTPVARMRGLCRATLGIEAPVIVAERGAVVTLGQRMLTPANIKGIRECREQLAATLRFQRHLVFVGNSTVWVRERRLFHSDRRIVLIDKQRQQTLSCFFLRTDSRGLPYIDSRWGNEALQLVGKVELPLGVSPWDYNPAYGIAIANAAEVSKTDGFRVLRGEYPDAAFYMIGDSDSDIIADDTVVHCGVGNASSNFKSGANFVARGSFTEGLEECIDWISRHDHRRPPFINPFLFS